MRVIISCLFSLSLALLAGEVLAEAAKPHTSVINRKTDQSTSPNQSQSASVLTSSVSASPGITGLQKTKRRSDGAILIEGTLAGQGEILDAGQHIIKGKVSPGNSPGCVTDHGNVIFEGSAWLEIELGGTSPCTGYDQYTVNLSLRLNGPTLRVLLIDGFVPSVGQRFDVLNWGTLTGTFGTLDLPVLPAGLLWDTSQLYTTGELIVAEDTADIPLPSWTLALLGGSLFAAMARRNRRQE